MLNCTSESKSPCTWRSFSWQFPLWKDLDESWNELSRNTLVKHHRDTDQSYADQVAEAHDVDLDELGVSVPVPADSSQLMAVADAVHGRTFVLEGPPGTGKSQRSRICWLTQLRRAPSPLCGGEARCPRCREEAARGGRAGRAFAGHPR